MILYPFHARVLRTERDHAVRIATALSRTINAYRTRRKQSAHAVCLKCGGTGHASPSEPFYVVHATPKCDGTTVLADIVPDERTRTHMDTKARIKRRRAQERAERTKPRGL